MADLVRVPGGRFTMGSARLQESDVVNPPHVVELSPFAIAKYPVTNAEYAAFLAATDRDPALGRRDPRFAGPGEPVINVSWDDALAYCTWAGGSLPTEAEWERAAAGLDERRYPWGEDEPDERHAHFAEDWNSGGPCAVGLHPLGASALGCEDLAGNTWEWCLDGWRIDAHLVRADSLDPILPSEGNVRPLRGGCWRSIAPKLQCAYRNWSHRIVRHVTIGFRLVVR